ncbi:MAG: GspH/FimT family pseudopilin [Noviherbaspirillum sp.]
MLRRSAGITLIELTVGLAIISSLLPVGMPSFTGWIQDLQIRGAAESIQSGLMLARSEAIRRNRPVRMRLANAGGMVEWQVGCVAPAEDCPEAIAQRRRGEGGRNTRMAAATVAADAAFDTALAAGAGLPASISFNGLGLTESAAPNRIEVSHVTLGAACRLAIVLGVGLARVCNPARDCA